MVFFLAVPRGRVRAGEGQWPDALGSAFCRSTRCRIEMCPSQTATTWIRRGPPLPRRARGPVIAHGIGCARTAVEERYVRTKTAERTVVAGQRP